MFHRTAASALATLLLSAAASAGVDFPLGNGNTVTGTIARAAEVEVFRLTLPKGAVLKLKGKAGKGGPELRARLRDPDGVEVQVAEGKTASISGYATAVSGVFKLELSAKDGAALGAYSLTAGWKSPTKFAATVTLDPAATGELAFAADAGGKAKLSAKPAKKSPAIAALDSLVPPVGPPSALDGTSTTATLAAGGGYALRFRNDGATAGGVTASVTVTPPKVKKRKIALTPNTVGGGTGEDFAFGSIVGADGGTVVLPDIDEGQPGAALSGASVTIPAGALGAPTAVVIATSIDVAVTEPAEGAGPSVFFGPEGLSFAPKSATVTIPYDPTFVADIANLVVYTRNAAGMVTIVPGPYTVDAVNHRISVATSHFSSFRCADTAPVEGARMFTAAVISGPAPQDFCIAFEPAGPTPRGYAFFVAGGDSDTVIGLVPGTMGFAFNSERFAGGGASTADGTPRLQYSFPATVTAVRALPDGQVFVATPAQVFLIGTDGNVTRFAGDGTPGDSGNDGPSVQARFTNITSILEDADGLYICDAGAHRIRFVDSGGTVRAFAGTGAQGVGTDGDLAADTMFVGPTHMALSLTGGLYVADAARLLKIDEEDGTVATVAGDVLGQPGTTDGPLLSARFQSVAGISVTFDLQTFGERVFVCDSSAHTIRDVNIGAGIVTTIAGEPGEPGDAPDMSLPTGALDTPLSIVATPVISYFLDSQNGKVRVIIQQ